MCMLCVILLENMVPSSKDLEIFSRDTTFAIEQKQRDYFDFGSQFLNIGKTLEEGRFLFNVFLPA